MNSAKIRPEDGLKGSIKDDPIALEETGIDVEKKHGVETKRIVDFDEIFSYMGQAGLFQILIYVMLGLPSYFSGYQNIAMTFLAPDQEHWCEVDRLQSFPYDVQKEVAIPYDTEEDAYEECDYYLLPYDNLTDDQIWNWDWENGPVNKSQVETGECDSWVYDQSEFTKTAVSEYDLVCDRTIFVSLSSSIYLFGILVGAPLSGFLSDKFGRKIVLLGGCVFQLIFGLIAAFMPTFASFSVFRFLTSMSVTHAYLTAFVLIMELIGPKYRTLAGVFYQIWFAIGFMLLPGFSYVVRDFRYLQIVMIVPVVVTALYFFMVPESPRWLIMQGREEEAKEIIYDIAEINDTPIECELEFALQQDTGDKGTFFDLFRYPVLRREILIIYLGWFTNSLVYYGLSLNTGDLVGSVFLNTFISGSVEIPANIICIFTMAYIGRKPTLAWSYIVAGVSSFLCIPFLGNEELAWLVTTFTMIGKAAITISFSTIYVFTAELFPTPVRHLAVGSSSMMSRVSGLIAPFMGEPLMNVWLPLPSMIFGIMGLVSGIATFFLPETLNRTMPDTIAEAEEIGRLGNKSKNTVVVNVNPTEDMTDYKSTHSRDDNTQNSGVGDNKRELEFENKAFSSEEARI